jgi:hypothetical protein
MSAVLHRESLEYVLFPLTIAPVDPATLNHEVAVVGEFDQPAGWVAASYVDGNIRFLVRASSSAPAGGVVTLDLGRWRVWWRTTSNPEEPVRWVGIISVV